MSWLDPHKCQADEIGLEPCENMTRSSIGSMTENKGWFLCPACYPKLKMKSKKDREIQFFKETGSLKKTEVKIGKDGLCTCSCGDFCVLGRAGMALRCSKEELEYCGVKCSTSY